MKNNILHLLGLGLRAKAADAETGPEELAQAALDVGEFQKPTAEDKKGRDKRRGRDVEEDEEELIAEDEADIEVTRTQDRKVRDKRKSRDNADIEVTRTQDKRRKMHDALDKMLDEQGCPGEDAEADDADLEELKKLLGEFFNEEEQEPQHQTEDADPSELEEVLGAGEQPDAEDELEAEPGEELAPSGEAELEADDEDPLEEEEEEEELVGDRAHAHDSRRVVADRSRAIDSARATLKMLRPAVARCKDSAVKNAFNAAYATVTRSSRAGSGSYGSFSRTAQARDVAARQPGGRARAADKAEESNKKMQDYYNQRVKEGK